MTRQSANQQDCILPPAAYKLRVDRNQVVYYLTAVFSTDISLTKLYIIILNRVQP